MNKNLLAEDLDDLSSSIAHGEMIRSKYFLREIYKEHYQFFARELESISEGEVLELGSGGGFLKELLPEAITSDLVPVPGLSLNLSALNLPFKSHALKGIVMINVLHHLQNVRSFFNEALHALRPGGKILMIEPANTLLANFIYSNFHHEPFDPKQEEWKLPPGGRMTSANDALPWIVFSRDRERFEAEFPSLKIKEYKNFMPFRYVLSGGVSRGQLLPDFCYDGVRLTESLLSFLNNQTGLFTRITLQKEI